MRQIEALPLLFPNGTATKQFSSYDPTGGNSDGSFQKSYTKYIDGNGEYVIFDASGPGCLYRQQYNVWSKGRVLDAGKTRIKYYFDDEPVARIDISADELFQGKVPPFEPPYTFIDPKFRFGISYYPLTYGKRLKITTTSDFDQLQNFDRLQTGGRYVHSWYQFTALSYPTDTSLKSWSNTESEYSNAVVEQWKTLGSDPKPSKGNHAISKSIELPAGTHDNILELEGKGSIAKLEIGLEPYSRDTFFRTHLRIYWDGSPLPSIDMPLANFFGGGGETYENCQAIHEKTLTTLMYGYSGKQREFYCYWPMPYWKSARIELWNDSQTNLDCVQLDVEYKPETVSNYPKDKSGYFCTQRTVSQDKGEAAFAPTFRERGRGHVVGISFYSKNFSMDGDEFTYIDDSRTPQIHGDGTEDDHNQGWGGDAYQKPLWGGLLNGYQGAYRLYLNDSYIFNRSIKTNYEYSYVGGENYGGQVDAVVYYYKSAQLGNLILTDVVDVGDPASERTHDYTLAGKTCENSHYSGYDGYERDYQHDMLRDTGYGYSGNSEFTASIAPKNSGIKLRRRIYRTDNGRQLAQVSVDGVKVTERLWDIVTQSTAPWYQGWYDADFEIPPSYTQGKSTIRLKVEYAEGSSQPEINEFYYWIFSYADGSDALENASIKELNPQTSGDGSSTEQGATASLAMAKNNTDSAGSHGSEGFVEFDYANGRVRSVLPEYISTIDFGDTDVTDGSIGNPSISSSLSVGPANSKLKNLGSFLINGSRTITLYANDQKQHRLSLDFPEIENNSRKQKIEILDLNENAIAPEVLLSQLEKGEIPTYHFSGAIKIQITNLEDQNTALVPALFFDAQQ